MDAPTRARITIRFDKLPNCHLPQPVRKELSNPDCAIRPCGRIHTTDYAYVVCELLLVGVRDTASQPRESRPSRPSPHCSSPLANLLRLYEFSRPYNVVTLCSKGGDPSTLREGFHTSVFVSRSSIRGPGRSCHLSCEFHSHTHRR